MFVFNAFLKFVFVSEPPHEARDLRKSYHKLATSSPLRVDRNLGKGRFSIGSSTEIPIGVPIEIPIEIPTEIPIEVSIEIQI